MMLSRTIARTTRQLATRRQMSAAPKMHKAKGNWEGIKEKRPIDADDLHLTFHPPFSPAVVVGILGGILVVGYGTMQYGVIHQQYKQGFWK